VACHIGIQQINKSPAFQKLTVLFCVPQTVETGDIYGPDPNGTSAVLDLRAVASSAATVAIRSRLIVRSTAIFSLQVWPHIRHSPCLLLSPPSPPSPTLLSFQLDPIDSLSSFAKPFVSSTLPLSRLQLGCHSVDTSPCPYLLSLSTTQPRIRNPSSLDRSSSGSILARRVWPPCCHVNYLVSLPNLHTPRS
jgi:hypothetical protein